VGVTQYTLSAEQWERVLMSSAATMVINGFDRAIICRIDCRKTISVLTLRARKLCVF